MAGRCRAACHLGGCARKVTDARQAEEGVNRSSTEHGAKGGVAGHGMRLSLAARVAPSAVGWQAGCGGGGEGSPWGLILRREPPRGASSPRLAALPRKFGARAGRWQAVDASGGSIWKRANEGSFLGLGCKPDDRRVRTRGTDTGWHPAHRASVRRSVFPEWNTVPNAKGTPRGCLYGPHKDRRP